MAIATTQRAVDQPPLAAAAGRAGRGGGAGARAAAAAGDTAAGLGAATGGGAASAGGGADGAGTREGGGMVICGSFNGRADSAAALCAPAAAAIWRAETITVDCESSIG